MRFLLVVFMAFFLFPIARSYAGETTTVSSDVKQLLSSANQGNVAAQTTLGAMYEDGLGVKQDYAEAYFWLSLAANFGGADHTPIVQDEIDDAAKHLTTEKIAAIKKRLAEWTPVAAPTATPVAAEAKTPPLTPEQIETIKKGVADLVQSLGTAPAATSPPPETK